MVPVVSVVAMVPVVPVVAIGVVLLLTLLTERRLARRNARIQLHGNVHIKGGNWQ